MKSIYFIIVLLLSFFTNQAQNSTSIPIKLLFQQSDIERVSVRRIPIRLSVLYLHNHNDSTIKYIEYQSASINNYGYATVLLGSGNQTYGKFDTINFTNGKHFIKIECDIESKGVFETNIITPINAVPYAMYSKNASLKGPMGEKGDTGVYLNSISRLNDTLIIRLIDGALVKHRLGKGAKGYDGQSIDTIIKSSDSLLIKKNVGTHIINNIKGPTGTKGRDARLGSYDHYIGEYFGGGVIFYLWHDSTGEHGLIISDQNLSDSFIWSNVEYSFLPDSLIDTWDGNFSTKNIVSDTNHTHSAAYLCDTSLHNGFDDWYLPSAGEMMLLFKNLIPVNSTLLRKGKQAFLTDRVYNAGSQSSRDGFWTSTESIANSAVSLMNFGFFTYTYKKRYLSVRAIRRF